MVASQSVGIATLPARSLHTCVGGGHGGGVEVAERSLQLAQVPGMGIPVRSPYVPHASLRARQRNAVGARLRTAREEAVAGRRSLYGCVVLGLGDP